MRHALVTGAPGFLGAHIVAQLVERGTQVRAMARPGESRDALAGLPVEIVEADVRDAKAMRRAMEGIDTLFHTAAIYEGWTADPGRMYAVNVDGTFHALEAARQQGVERVIYTASVVALGRPTPGQLADETTPWNEWDIDFPYARSKYLSKRIAEDFAAWGLDVRVVCPGMVVGPGDRVPTPSGRTILTLARGEAPGYTSGGAAYVDVRDAALGHLRAAERGRAGESYIVAAHNLSHRELLDEVCRVCGLRRRSIRIPLALARAWVRTREAIAVRRGQVPDVGSKMFEYSLRPVFYDNRKAVQELDMTYRPFAETVRDAIEDFRQRGVL